jgi:hypothetical protein
MKKAVRPGTLIIRKLKGKMNRAQIVAEIAAMFKRSEKWSARFLDSKVAWSDAQIKKLAKWSGIDYRDLLFADAAYERPAPRPKPTTTGRNKIVVVLRKLWLWSRERRVVEKRAGGRCECCGQKSKLEVHHKAGINWQRIEEVLRSELFCCPEDLIAVCPGCHSKQHDPLPFE